MVSMRLGMLVAGLCAPALWAEDVAAAARQVLERNCGQCHFPPVTMANVDLSSRDKALPVLSPGRVEDSKLWRAVKRDGKIAMPPGKPLPAADVAVLREWIEKGAPWPAQVAAKPEPPKWWSFRVPVRPPVPTSNAANPIDAFLRTKLADAGLRPAAEASRATLIRRASLNLTGLPPTAAQVDAFVRDARPDAYEKLIEELLASPHYGEKWGRHWLDLVRYSDTAGFELDSYIADAWRYRDYVIASFNQDKPYDRFIREQIAGDELWPEDPPSVSGTGHYCVGPNRDLFPDQADINREETLTDFVDTTSAVFLGLTVGCARCHDHKFDPIPQRDYYRLQAVFAPAVKTKVALNRLNSLFFDVSESVREIKLRELGDQIRAARGRCNKQLFEAKLAPLPADVQEALRLNDDTRTAKQRELATNWGDRVKVSDEEVRACMNPAETAQLTKVERQLVQMYSGYSAKPFACGITDYWDVAPKTFVPARGGRPKQEVGPGFLSALGGGDITIGSLERPRTGPIPLAPTTGRRKALAEWIASPGNPLTARVMVNRIWQYHFGRGLVRTPSDYGTRGSAPTHPQLLDWLATEFVARQWSVKEMHRLIMTSAAYRQDSVTSPEAAAKDPENLWLSHFSRRRMTSDEIRDSLLLVTGRLNRKAGGRPVVPPATPEELFGFTQSVNDAWIVTADESEHHRRSIYLIQKRTFRMPLMEVFDAPESMLTCPKRESSTTAPQSLTLLNGRVTMDAARKLATELTSAYADDGAMIAAAWRRVLARDPHAEEVRLAREFLARQGRGTGAATELVRSLLNTNEYLYVD
jgi:hypothetical protein